MYEYRIEWHLVNVPWEVEHGPWFPEKEYFNMVAHVRKLNQDFNTYYYLRQRLLYP